MGLMNIVRLRELHFLIQLNSLGALRTGPSIPQLSSILDSTDARR
jgi:hypothetical protein